MTRWMDRLRLRFRSLFRRREADAALAREIALHLEEEARELIARGMSPLAARDAARRAFGPVAAVEDACRDTRRVSRLQSAGEDLRHAWRALLHQPLLVAAAAASIGLGAGANTLIFGLATELLLAPPTTRDPEQLVNIRLGGNSHVSYQRWRELAESHALGGLTGYNVEASINWRDGARTLTVAPLFVTANFFDVLGVPFALGRGFSNAEAAAERNPRVVVVSHGFWSTRLASDPGVVGRTLVVNGEVYTVLGVLRSGVRSITGFGLAPELYLPVSRSLMPDLDHPHGAAVQLVGRLRSGQSVDQGRAALNTVVQRQATRQAGIPDHVGMFARVTDGVPDLTDIRTFFLILFGVVTLVLAIACANVTGLLLARSTARRRETAVRLALGATRGRLVQQMLAETFWLACAGAVAGLLLMAAVVAALSRLTLPIPIPMEIRAPLDLRLLGYALALVLLATLFSGLVPALQATRPSLTPALKQDVQGYLHRRWTLRGLLVAGQVMVAMVLLVTALLFLRNLARTHLMDPGFEVERALVAQVSFVQDRHTEQGRLELLERAVQRLEALPGVARASYALGLPLSIRHGRTSGSEVWLEDEGQAKQVLAYWAENMVGPGYFETMGIPLRAGRDFRPQDDPDAPRAVVINEAFASRYLGPRSPVGRRLLLPGADKPDAYEIVGIVANSKHRTLGEEQMAAVYFAYAQRPGSNRLVHVIVRSSPVVDGQAAAVTHAVSELDPTAAVDVQSMRQMLAFAFLPSQVGAALLGSMGVLGLTLAMAGLFAMLSYAVVRRTREIGVRMALGATRRAVAGLVARDAAVLVGTGMLLGLGISALVTPALTTFLVAGLAPNDPVSFAGTALLFALVSAAAVWLPVRRAMDVEPVTALRDE